MGNKMEKKQIILVSTAGLTLVGAILYLFVFDADGYSGGAGSYSGASATPAEQFVPAPREATLEEYRQATEDESLIDASSRGEIEELYHQRLVAQLKADIAALESQKNSSEIENERAAAEIEEMRARIERENRLVAIQEREANSTQDATASQRSPSMNDEEEGARIAAIDAQIERSLRQAAPRPERTARLHQAKADYAMVSIDGVMRRMRIGESAGGVRLVSTNEGRGSAVVHGHASGERVTLSLEGNTSRRLATIRPLTGDNNNSDEYNDE